MKFIGPIFISVLALLKPQQNHYSVNKLVELLGGPVKYISKRPGEPYCTFADTRKIKKLLEWAPQTDFQTGVQNMLNNIENWKDAPVWDENSILKATDSWFRYLKKE